MPPILRNRTIAIALFLGVALVLAVLRLMPITPGRVGWPGPDLLLCLTFAWMLRRPDLLPALVIGCVFLVDDLLFWRPPGLWACLVLLGSEALRRREGRWRDQGFVFEWFGVGLLLGLMVMANRLIMGIFLLPLPAFGQIFLQYLATVAAYPVVVLAARLLFGLRRLTQSELELLRYQ